MVRTVVVYEQLRLNRGEIVGRPKLKFRNIRVLQKNNSGSYTLSIPLDIIDELNWRSKQKLKVERKGNKVIITNAWATIEYISSLLVYWCKYAPVAQLD